MTVQMSECERLAAVSEKSQVIGEFIEWLRDTKRWQICQYDTAMTRWWLVTFAINNLLAKFFGIDLNKVEAERRALLADIQGRVP